MPSARLSGEIIVPSAGLVTTVPSIEITPASAFSKPAIKRIRTVLPQPEGPSKVKHSPSFSSRSKEDNTVFSS